MNTQTITRSFTKILVLAIGLAIGVYGTNAYAEESIKSTVTVHSASKTISDTEWQTLSYSAGRIIKHVDLARFSIDQKNKQGAIDQVEKGLTLVQIIESVIPPVQVNTEIKAGDVVYKDEDNVNEALIPIYNNSVRYDILAPVMRAKNEAAKNQPSVKVLQEGIDFSTEYLKIHIAKTYLESAKHCLQSDNLVEADKMLVDLLDRGTVFESVQYEMPMSRAASLMGASEKAYNENNYTASETFLRQAADVMSEYAKTLKSEDRVILERVCTNLNDLADVVHDQNRHSSFSSKFSSLWNEITGIIRNK